MKTLFRFLFFFLLVTQICFAQWYQQNSGTNAKLNSVHFEDSNIGWAVGDSGIILHTTNGGQEWIIQISGTTTSLSDISFIDHNNGLAVGGGPQYSLTEAVVLQTSNGGQYWLNRIGSGEGIILNRLSYNSWDNVWVVGSIPSLTRRIGAIFFSGNGGSSWYLNSILESYYFTDVCFTNAEIGIVIGNSYGVGPVSGNTLIMKTTDSGNSWLSQNNDLSAIFFIDSSNGWGVGNYGMFPRRVQILKTIDGGENWTSLLDQPTIEDNFLNNIHFTDINKGWVVGDAGTVLYTVDGGTTWIPQQSGTTNNLNNVFFTDFNNGWIIGDNGTILHTSNAGVTFIEEAQANVIPTEFLLFQNYPNPFNSSSIIKYSIPKSSQVSLKIFNALGQEIETLVNEEKPVGTYQVNWNAVNLPSGIYFYQLQAGDFIQTRKMILLK